MNAIKPRVLLVEDEELISMLTEDMLSDLGYVVEAAVATLEAGLQAAAKGGFDVAVLDINLRGKSSLPIADMLANRNVPFVIVSGYATAGIDGRHLEAPSLQKPFTGEDLEQELARVLRRQRGRS